MITINNKLDNNNIHKSVIDIVTVYKNILNIYKKEIKKCLNSYKNNKLKKRIIYLTEK